MAKTKQEGTGLGPKPEFHWVKLSQPYAPTEYQHSVKSNASAKNIKHIRNRFTWAEFVTLVVCPTTCRSTP